MTVVDLKFRPIGAPAGSWPHGPWWHCVFHDPYERINFWSHFLPGVALLLLGCAALAGAAPGGTPLGVFCCCAALTHLLSALTHVWPDDHLLEKADHLGIVALIMGTPLTQHMALQPQGDRTTLWACCAGLLGAAFLPPAPRVVSFVGLGTCLFVASYHLVGISLLVQCALYLGGAVAFLRNGGHSRLPWGLTDHHLLHYQVTVACALQVANLIALQQQQQQQQLGPSAAGPVFSGWGMYTS